jgi:zinc protease
MHDLTRRLALKGAAAAVAVPLAAPALAQTGGAQTREAPPPRVDRPLFGAVSWTLGNGLRVVLAENKRAPVAAHYLYVSAGRARTRPGSRARRISWNT